MGSFFFAISCMLAFSWSWGWGVLVWLCLCMCVCVYLLRSDIGYGLHACGGRRMMRAMWRCFERLIQVYNRHDSGLLRPPWLEIFALPGVGFLSLCYYYYHTIFTTSLHVLCEPHVAIAPLTRTRPPPRPSISKTLPSQAPVSMRTASLDFHCPLSCPTISHSLHQTLPFLTSPRLILSSPQKRTSANALPQNSSRPQPRTPPRSRSPSPHSPPPP